MPALETNFFHKISRHVTCRKTPRKACHERRKTRGRHLRTQRLFHHSSDLEFQHRRLRSVRPEWDSPMSHKRPLEKIEDYHGSSNGGTFSHGRLNSGICHVPYKQSEDPRNRQGLHPERRSWDTSNPKSRLPSPSFGWPNSWHGLLLTAISMPAAYDCRRHCWRRHGGTTLYHRLCTTRSTRKQQ